MSSGASVGFTGTRSGMTIQQKETFTTLITSGFPANPFLFHHGDCIGADAEAHQIIRHTIPNSRIIIHHPGHDKNGDEPTRAKCKGNVILPAKPYLVRDREIVDVSTILLATPKSHQRFGGTWSTIEYGQKRRKSIVIIWPDGTTTTQRQV